MILKVKGLYALGFLLVLAFNLIPVVPVAAWHHPCSTDDKYFEMFGPRVDELLIKIYNDYPPEFEGFLAKEIDVMDWPLLYSDWEHLEAIDPDHEQYSTAFYTEFVMFEFDINNGKQWLPGMPYTATPTCETKVRKALAHLVDKDYFIDTYLSAIGHKADSPIAHLPAFYNPACTNAYQLEVATTLSDDIADLDAAANYLTAALGAPTVEGDGYYWRWTSSFTDENEITGPIGDDTLLVYCRTDPNRANLGAYFKARCEQALPFNSVYPGAGVKVMLQVKSRTVCFDEVMTKYRYHLYSGGWGLSRDPDNLAFGYASYMCWAPAIYSPNYLGYGNLAFDAAWISAESAASATAAKPFLYECQRLLINVDCAMVPVWNPADYKAYLSKWESVVNEVGFGVNSWWTFLNAYDRNDPDQQGGIIRYGFSSDIERLSVIHSEWYWDTEVLGKIYNRLFTYNPYDETEDFGMIAQDWDIGTWTYEGETLTKITFHIRKDIMWQDVPPNPNRKWKDANNVEYPILLGGATNVALTPFDVAFSYIYVRDNLDAWNRDPIKNVHHVSISACWPQEYDTLPCVGPIPEEDGTPIYEARVVKDPAMDDRPWDVDVYMGVLSPWLGLHTLNTFILPSHIYSIVPNWDRDGDGKYDTRLFEAWDLDCLYGCGPFILTSRTPGVQMIMKPYKAGQTYGRTDIGSELVTTENSWFDWSPVRITRCWPRVTGKPHLKPACKFEWKTELAKGKDQILYFAVTNLAHWLCWDVHVVVEVNLYNGPWPDCTANQLIATFTEEEQVLVGGIQSGHPYEIDKKVHIPICEIVPPEFKKCSMKIGMEVKITAHIKNRTLKIGKCCPDTGIPNPWYCTTYVCECGGYHHYFLHGSGYAFHVPPHPSNKPMVIHNPNPGPIIILVGTTPVTLAHCQSIVVPCSNDVTISWSNWVDVYWVCCNELQWFHITIPGDVNGDCKVDMMDIVAVIITFGLSSCAPKYKPNNDVTCDCKIDMMDIVAQILNFGKTCAKPPCP